MAGSNKKESYASGLGNKSDTKDPSESSALGLAGASSYSRSGINPYPSSFGGLGLNMNSAAAVAAAWFSHPAYPYSQFMQPPMTASAPPPARRTNRQKKGLAPNAGNNGVKYFFPLQKKQP